MASPTKRLHYVDHLRVLLASLVILHHVAITYGGSGSWSYTEGPVDSISFAVLTFFTATNQAFFMGAFFLLAGFFAARSIERVGPWRFVARRLVRLGIPLLFYAAVISPLMVAMLGRFVWGWQGTYAGILRFLYQIWWPPGTGPLWFVEWLLVLCVGYAAVRGLALRRRPSPHRHSRPGWREILVFAVMLGAVSFVVRLFFPVGWVWPPLNAQLAYYTQYVALFVVGVRAAYQDGLAALVGERARVWTWLVACFLLLFPALFAVGGAMSGDVDAFMGGMTWQALAYALWDQLLGLSLIALLLIVFRRRLDRPTWASRELAPSAYGAFILHAPVVVGVGVALRPLDIPPIPKFLVAGAIALTLCFVFAGLIRRLPLVRKVIG